MREIKIQFVLVGEEAIYLRQICNQEVRRPVDQVRYLLKKEFERRGYISPEEEQYKKKENQHGRQPQPIATSDTRRT